MVRVLRQKSERAEQVAEAVDAAMGLDASAASEHWREKAAEQRLGHAEYGRRRDAKAAARRAEFVRKVCAMLRELPEDTTVADLMECFDDEFERSEG